MRITFITHYPELYGANRSLLNLIDGLREYHVEPSVICRVEGPITQELSKRKIPFAIFPFELWLMEPHPRHRINGLIRLMKNLALLPRMKRQLLEWQPDLIHTNSSVTPIGAFLAKALNKPHVWHIREFGLLDYNSRHDLGKCFFKYWLNQAAAVIAISMSIKEIVLQGVRSRIERIYNGVISINDLEKSKSEQLRSTVGGRPFTYLLAGVLRPSKCQDEAIRALTLVRERHEDVRLLVAGSGDEDYLNALMSLAAELGVAEKVEFLGFVPDIFRLFRDVDAVLMCSRFEAMGRITAEAMAFGKAVIGFDAAGTSELIVNGETGLLYSGSHSELAECMLQLIDKPELKASIEDQAYRKALDNFTTEVYAGKVFDVLNSVWAGEKSKM